MTLNNRRFHRCNNPHCFSTVALDGQHIMTSGAIHIERRCQTCDGHQGFIPQADYETNHPNWRQELPIFKDATNHTPCERCHTTSGVELHHWAPRALFNDAELWPKAWLCRRCHTHWHTTINTANSNNGRLAS